MPHSNPAAERRAYPESEVRADSLKPEWAVRTTDLAIAAAKRAYLDMPGLENKMWMLFQTVEALCMDERLALKLMFKIPELVVGRDVQRVIADRLVARGLVFQTPDGNVLASSADQLRAVLAMLEVLYPDEK